MQVVSGPDLPDIGFKSNDPFDPEKIGKAGGSWYKPYAGLWTSPFNEQGMTAWEWWSLMADYESRLQITTRVTAKKHSRFLQISCKDSMMSLPDEYFVPMKSQFMESPARLNWEKVTSEFDGLWVTEKAARECNGLSQLELPRSLGAWDVETVLFFHGGAVNTFEQV